MFRANAFCSRSVRRSVVSPRRSLAQYANADAAKVDARAVVAISEGIDCGSQAVSEDF